MLHMPNLIVSLRTGLFAAIAALIATAEAAGVPKFNEEVVYSFKNYNDGAVPYAGLIEIGNALYSTTNAGGKNESGTVFSVDLNTGAEKALAYLFNPEMDPISSVLDVHGTLYGTVSGFNNGYGTLFSLDLQSGDEQTVFTFCSPDCASGAFPNSGLIKVGKLLYGVTARGGSGTNDCNDLGCGTVFSFDPKTGIERVLYSFCSEANCSDGSYPSGNLIALNGTLYGTTAEGGQYGIYGTGTVFSFNLKSGREKVLHSFGSRADGRQPLAGLIALNGLLYGTTVEGGKVDDSTVFSLNLKTGVEAVLYSFCSTKKCADGLFPESKLIAVDGILYGTAFWGGNSNCQNGCGTVFSIDPNTGAETTIHIFAGGPTDGGQPEAGLLNVKGSLYGTTSSGGASDSGTVYVLKPR